MHGLCVFFQTHYNPITFNVKTLNFFTCTKINPTSKWNKKNTFVNTTYDEFSVFKMINFKWSDNHIWGEKQHQYIRCTFTSGRALTWNVPLCTHSVHFRFCDSTELSQFKVPRIKNIKKIRNWDELSWRSVRWNYLEIS